MRTLYSKVWQKKKMAEDVKDRIIKGAAELFKRKGIKAVTMDEIAVKLSISKRTIYENFKDKQSIINSCLDSTFKNLEDEMNDISKTSSNPVEALFCMFEYVDIVVREYNKQFFEDLVGTVTEDDYKDKKYRHRALISAKVKSAIDEGFFRNELGVDIITALLTQNFSPLIAELNELGLHPSPLELKLRVNLILLKGIATQKGAKVINELQEKASLKMSGNITTE